MKFVITSLKKGKPGYVEIEAHQPISEEYLIVYLPISEHPYVGQEIEMTLR